MVKASDEAQIAVAQSSSEHPKVQGWGFQIVRSGSAVLFPTVPLSTVLSLNSLHKVSRIRLSPTMVFTNGEGVAGNIGVGRMLEESS